MRETTDLARNRQWPGFVLVVGVCYGVGIAAGMMVSPKREFETTTDARAAAPSITAMVGASVEDEDVHDAFPKLKGWETADFIREMRKLPGGDVDSPGIQTKWMAFAIRWVLEDAEGGADYLVNREDETPYKHFRWIYFRVWLQQDSAAASAYADRLKATSHPFADSLLETCAEVTSWDDPEEVLRDFKPEEFAARGHEFNQGILRLAEKDPQRAMAYLADIDDIETRANVVKALAEGWARSDASAAMAWARGLPEVKERNLALDAVIGQLSKSDVSAAMAAYGELVAMGADTNALFTDLESRDHITYALAEKDPAEAFRWIETSMGGKIDPQAMEVVSPFLPRDPGDFRAMLEKLEPGSFRDAVAACYLVDFNGDPATMLARLSELPDDGTTGTMRKAGVVKWLESDPEATRTAILNLQGSERARMASEALGVPGSFDSVESAIAFARATGVRAVPVAFADWAGARGGVEEAARFVASLAQEKGIPAAAAALVHKWAERAPGNAAAWSATLDDESLRAAVSAPLVSAWARTDSYAASEWVAGLNEGLARDAAAEVLARSILREEPSSAVAWALTLDDPVKREPLLKDAFRQWFEYSRAEAEGALGQADVSEALRNSILHER